MIQVFLCGVRKSGSCRLALPNALTVITILSTEGRPHRATCSSRLAVLVAAVSCCACEPLTSRPRLWSSKLQLKQTP